VSNAGLFFFGLACALIAIAVGYGWGRSDGRSKAYDELIERWLRQCKMCGADHLRYAAQECQRGSELREVMRKRWKSLGEDD
jgi:hypothetical protein